MSNQPGQLHVVATPIGNLGDLSARARDVLAAASLVAAEDTRHTGRLLNNLGVRRPLLSLHEHNETARIERLRDVLESGGDVALVSDAGTPLISDPGFRVVRGLRLAGFEVLAVPGPSSITAALSVAGLPTDRFFFEGFLPARSGARRRRLEALAGLDHTLVVLEAGRRIQATLQDLCATVGAEREGAICRELTKRHESTYLDTLGGLADALAADSNRLRGEFVLLVGPAPTTSSTPALPPSADLLALLRAEGLGARAAARVTARLTGESANALYKEAAALSGR